MVCCAIFDSTRRESEGSYYYPCSKNVVFFYREYRGVGKGGLYHLTNVATLHIRPKNKKSFPVRLRAQGSGSGLRDK